MMGIGRNMLSNITFLYKLMMGIERSKYFKLHIRLQIDDGNGNKHILANITCLLKLMMGMGIYTCYQSIYTITN